MITIIRAMDKTLDKHIVGHIFGFLKKQELCGMRNVCHYFNNVKACYGVFVFEEFEDLNFFSKLCTKMIRKLVFRPNNNTNNNNICHVIFKTYDLSNVISIQFYKCKLTVDICKYLEHMPIRYLSIDWDVITDPMMEAINNIKTLLTFESNCCIGDVGIFKFSKLENLGLIRSKFFDLNCVFSDIAKLGTLRTLNVSGTRITDDELVHISKLVGLTSLIIDHTRITDNGLATLANAKINTLKVLNIMFVPITDDGIRHVSCMTKLVSINLTGSRMTDDGLAAICRLMELETLDISFTHVTNDGLIHLLGLPRLSTLDVGYTSITDNGLSIIAKLTSLSSLQLYNTKVTEAGFVHISCMKRLEKLNVGDVRVTSVGFDHVLAIGTLLKLTISGNMVSMKDL